jgi:hypothetical protein
MYNQLLKDYSTLTYHYHEQSEANFTLYHKLENLLQEKIFLLQDSTTTLSALPLLPSLLP